MPIIRTSRQSEEGLVESRYEGDKFIFRHVEKVDDLARANYEMRKDPAAAWSKGKGFRLIARVPEIAFRAHPELGNPDGRVNIKEMRKFLRSDEGHIFRTVESGF